MASLEEITKQIQNSAKKLLQDKTVDVVIGYQKGTTPLNAKPFLARTEEDCEKLVWTNFATTNLTTFISKRPGKMAIVAKGCDARSAVGQVFEKQIEKENLYIIGVACSGMVDSWKVLAKEKRSIQEVQETTDSIKLIGDGFETEINKSEVLRRNCEVCKHSTTDLADTLIGEKKVVSETTDDFNDIKELLEKSDEEKLAYFKNLIKDCIRCYACRSACPLCYCPVCFVDETQPQWLGKSQDTMDTLVFHMMRGFHCAGRCTSCGACESACPVNIKVREFNRIMEKEVFERWAFEPGLTWDEKAPLSTYKPDDEAKFIK